MALDFLDDVKDSRLGVEAFRPFFLSHLNHSLAILAGADKISKSIPCAVGSKAV